MFGVTIILLLYQTLAFTVHGKIFKKSYKNNKFKISALTWNDKFEFPDGSNSVSDRKYEPVTDNPSIRLYVKKIENRIKERKGIILNF